MLRVLQVYHLGDLTVLILLYVRERTYIILLPKNLNILKNKKSKTVTSKGDMGILSGII